jgi:hypothetical protein
MWVRRGCAILGAVSLLLPAGCADIWGIRDLSGEVDSGPDATAAAEGGPDGAVSDGAVTADALVTPGDGGGCGPTNTVYNCGACGVVCDLSHATGVSCDGTKCIYE